MSVPKVELSELCVRYGRSIVLQNISTCISAGELTLLVGDNGAGKSTLLRAICGLKRPASGTIKFGDRVNGAHNTRVSLSTDSAMLYSALSVRENLDLFCRLSQSKASLDQEINRWQILKLLSKRFSQISRGEQLRVQLALTFSICPDFILLDEPTNTLDRGARAVLLSAISTTRNNAGVVVATHEPDFFEQLKPRVLTLNGGRLKEADQ